VVAAGAAVIVVPIVATVAIAGKQAILSAGLPSAR